MKRAYIVVLGFALFVVGVYAGNFITQKLGDEAIAGAGASSTAQRPEFSLPDLNGNLHNIAEWDGKILLINFWATWCPPCRKEIPGFNVLQKKYSNDVQFIGIAIDDDIAVKQFMKIIPINYPVLIGADKAIEIAKSYGNISGALPYTVIIDRSGFIVSISEGGISEADTEAAIKRLLSLNSLILRRS